MRKVWILPLVVLAALALACAQERYDPTPIPTATAAPTPEPTPAPELLGGEDRRACGLFWESYEWAVIDRRGTPVYAWLGKHDATVYYFTSHFEHDGVFVTLRDGCVLYESSSFLRGDTHRDFDVEQFRVEETELYHNRVRVQPKGGP